MTPHDPRQDTPQDAAVSRLYQTQPANEPPAALDAAILAAARAAVSPAEKRRPWWQRLQIPMAVTATGLLAVMLTLTMERNPEPAPPSASPNMAAPEAAPMAERADLSQPPKALSTPMPEKAPAARREQATVRAEPPPSLQPQAQDNAKREVPPPPLATGAASGNATPSAAWMADRAAPSAAPAPALRQEYESRKPAAPAADAASSEAAAAPMPLGKMRVAPQVQSPEAWIARIRDLRQRGLRDEAREQWFAFRKAYPNYALPDDLKDAPLGISP